MSSHRVFQSECRTHTFSDLSLRLVLYAAGVLEFHIPVVGLLCEQGKVCWGMWVWEQQTGRWAEPVGFAVSPPSLLVFFSRFCLFSEWQSPSILF